MKVYLLTYTHTHIHTSLYYPSNPPHLSVFHTSITPLPLPLYPHTHIHIHTEGLLDESLLKRMEGFMYKKGGVVNARGESYVVCHES
jgi:hypothetical protein